MMAGYGTPLEGEAPACGPRTPKRSEGCAGASSFAGLRRTGSADGPCEPRRETGEVQGVPELVPSRAEGCEP
jgi:hypothetical protein